MAVSYERGTPVQAITKLTSGDIIDALARATTLEKINISNNKIADMMPMG